MSYDYVPKDKSAARMTGKARVTLGLVKTDGRNGEHRNCRNLASDELTP